MRYYSYPEFLRDMKLLVAKMADFRPDAIVAVARGGLTIAQMLCEYYDIRQFYAINSTLYDGVKRLDSVHLANIPTIDNAKDVLVVDEIVDSGKSLATVIEALSSAHPWINFKSAALFQKSTASFCADYYLHDPGDVWVEFFWEVDLLRD
ncbi:MAG: phosphoribosyltransferase [Campylobacterales bacterium]